MDDSDLLLFVLFVKSTFWHRSCRVRSMSSLGANSIVVEYVCRLQSVIKCVVVERQVVERISREARCLSDTVSTHLEPVRPSV
jgi:hypothetical protein